MDWAGGGTTGRRSPSAIMENAASGGFLFLSFPPLFPPHAAISGGKMKKL